MIVHIVVLVDVNQIEQHYWDGLTAGLEIVDILLEMSFNLV